MNSYFTRVIEPDAAADSSAASSSPDFSPLTWTVYSPEYPAAGPHISGIPNGLPLKNAARNNRKKPSFHTPQVQAQAVYLENTVKKLHTELSRVRHSTSITELSKSRLGLSSIERELASKSESSNTRYRHLSRHFTQLQGVYGKAFSEISKAASGKDGPRISVQSTLKSSIDVIAKEYENFIVSLGSELDTIAVTATKQTTQRDRVPDEMDATSLPEIHNQRSNLLKEGGVANRSRTRDSEAVLNTAVVSDQAPTVCLDGPAPEAQAGERNEKRIDLRTTSDMKQTQVSVATKGGTQLELVRETPDCQWINNYQELQVRHATTVEELEQVRALYLSTLGELDEMTVQHAQAQQKHRRPSLASLSNSYSPQSTSPAASSHSPVLLSSRRSPIRTNSSTHVSRHSGRQDYCEIPNNKSLAEKEDLLETINADGQAAKSRLQEENRQGSVSRSRESNALPFRNFANFSPFVPIRRAYSNSRTTKLQPLNLPLMRSSSLSLSEFSILRGLASSPSSLVFASQPSASGHSSPATLDFANDQQIPHKTQRSSESLEQEVLHLQNVLKDREEEIRVLELTNRQTPRLIESIVSLNPDSHVESAGVLGFSRGIPSQTPQRTAGGRESITSSEALAHGIRVDHTSLLPDVSCIISEVPHTPCSDSHRHEPSVSDNNKSLNLLMRSMAKKESEYSKTVKELKQKLESTERQHEALVKLSADQMLNMSSEIEALREKLKMSQTPDSEVSRIEVCSAGPMCWQAPQNEQIRQAEIQDLKEAHELVLAKLKAERSDNIHQLFSFTQEKIMAKEKELKQLEAHWQNKLKAELSAQADFIWAEADHQQNNLVKAQMKSSQLKSSRDREDHNREIRNLSKSHAEKTEKLKEEMESRLVSAQSDFANQIQELQFFHAQEVAQLTSSMTSTAGQMETNESKTRYIETIQTLEIQNQQLSNEKLALISQHEIQLDETQAEHSREVSALQVEHDEILIASLSELDYRRTMKFQDQLKTEEEKYLFQISEMKTSYEEQITILKSNKTLTYQPQNRKEQTPASSSSVEEFPELQNGRRSQTVSLGVNSTIDSTVLDPSALQKIREQESAISKLTKQLSNCEDNLKANIASIAQLEEALNDTERNLRKSRLQMNGLVQERDKMSIQNQRLQMELWRSNSEIESLKQSLEEEKLHLENRLNEESIAREAVRNQLESRMLEFQKLSKGKKSRFNCF
ncbi:hypothetical protein PCASD_09596 [Puccinia coronata f. sp. avenae]|nr:hypothetical protein PCASD_09596 [Puccinia coronata f. sp. avenae]